MRIGIVFFLLISSLSAFAQWKTFGIEGYPHSNARNSAAQSDTIYTLQLPFWDDFSASGSTPDTLLWAIGSDIFVNATLGINAPSYKVATFDGLTGTGAAHNLESTYGGPTDSLVSHYIDLSKVSDFNKNTVYLSFYWEAWGLGEMPDETDSLILQVNTTEGWETLWIKHGGETNPYNEFKQEMIQLKEDRYFHDEFRIKFKSTSNQKGPFDTWHLDYVYLNERRTGSPSHFDRTLTGVISPLFVPYQTISAEHFYLQLENSLSTQNTFATNLDQITPGHPLDYYYQLENSTTSEVYNFSSLGHGGNGNLEKLEMRELIGPQILTLPDEFTKLDSQIVTSTFYYKSGDKNLFEQINGVDTVFLPINLKVNDTIRTQYLVQDHYAYDDGTAEYAAAINLQTGMVAVKYVLPRKDTLTHVDIYFPNIAGDGKDKSISIMVWDQLTTKGVRLKQSFTVSYPSKLNTFTRIKLSESIITKDSVYIGYQQNTNEYIGIGLDRNSPAGSNKIYTKISSTWEQNSRLSGSLMIRPVFGRDTTLLPLDTTILNLDSKRFAVGFPNPNHGQLQVNGNHQKIELYDLSGHLIYAATADEEYDISFLGEGIYLLRIYNNNSFITQKLIINDD